MKTSLLFIMLLLMMVRLSAQPAKSIISDAKDIAFSNDSVQHKITLEFDCPQRVHDLLVLITDSLGETVFLESKYEFDGHYKHVLDVSKWPSGNYSLKIIRDAIRSEKKIRVGKMK